MIKDAGYGLFAKKIFKAGDMIAEVKGPILKKEFLKG